MDDQKAREERARRLREEISKVVDKSKEGEPEQPAPAESKPEKPHTESPREFIHRRMKDLDKS